MLKKLTALVLALLIANPFCCCLAFDDPAPNSEEPAVHFCCHESSNQPMPSPGLPADSEEQPPCSCLKDKPAAALAAKDTVASPEWQLLDPPAPLPRAEAELILPALVPVDKPVPADSGRWSVTPRDRLAHFCALLI